jgi:hypothetical protein
MKRIIYIKIKKNNIIGTIVRNKKVKKTISSGQIKLKGKNKKSIKAINKIIIGLTGGRKGKRIEIKYTGNKMNITRIRQIIKERKIKIRKIIIGNKKAHNGCKSKKRVRK